MRTRSSFLGILAAVLSLAAGQLAAESPTSPADATKQKPSAASPEELTPPPPPPVVPARATIAVLGDSLADGIWGGLVRRLVRDKRYTIYRGARNSSGLTGDPLIGTIDQAYAAGPVDAVVMMVGANDRRGIYTDDNLTAPYKSPQWPDTYRTRAKKFMEAVAGHNTPLVWVLLPVMKDDGAEADARQINALMGEAATGNARVSLVDIRPLTSAPDGTFSTYLKDAKGEQKLLRHTDGVHFSDYGYDLIANAVFARLSDVSVPLWLMTTRK